MDTKSLDYFGKVGRGKSRHRPRNDPSLYGGPYPFIQTADITNSDLYVTSYSQTYSEAGLAQSKLWEPGVLCIVNAGVNTGDSSILGIQACFPDSVISFSANPKRCDVRFIKYFLDSVKSGIRSITMGATQDNLSVSKLLTIKVPAYPLETQRKIAGILSAYDDLIENNRRRIAILERMAEELYREWFVRMRFPGYQNTNFVKGVPKDWEVKMLGEIYRTATGGTPSRTDPSFFNGSIRWVKTGELKQIFLIDTEEHLSEAGIDASSAKVFPRHTIVMAMYCKMADLTILAEPASTNQACCALQPRFSYTGFAFSYQLIKFAQRHLITFAYGAAQQNLSQEMIRSYRVLLPARRIVERYSEYAGQFFCKIEILQRESIVLEKKRNALLNRLVSGKISLNDSSIAIPKSMLEKELAHA